MYVYIIVDLIMFAFMLMCRKARLRRCNLYLGICCVLWALIFGLRAYSVGNDTRGYAGFYEGTNAAYWGYGTYRAADETLEMGFIYIVRILRTISTSATFFFLVHGGFLFVLIYCYYRNKRNSVMSLLWLMTFGSMIVTLMVAQRQSWSLCFVMLGVILLYAIPIHLNEKYKLLFFNYKFWLSVLCFTIAIFIHRSSILIFPVLLGIYFLRNNKIISYTALIFTFFFAVFYGDAVSKLFEMLLLQIGGIGYEKVSLLSERYINGVYLESASVVRFLSLVIPACVSIYYSKDEKVNSFSFKCYIIGLVLYMLFSTSAVISRIVAVFVVLGFRDAIPNLRKNSYLNVFYIMVSTYYLWRCIAGYFTDAHTLQNTYVLYKFIWE